MSQVSAAQLPEQHPVGVARQSANVPRHVGLGLHRPFKHLPSPLQEVSSGLFPLHLPCFFLRQGPHDLA
jgi:hypothetical protein